MFDIRRKSIAVENFYLKIAEIDIAQSTIWKVFDDVGPAMLHPFEQALNLVSCIIPESTLQIK